MPGKTQSIGKQSVSIRLRMGSHDAHYAGELSWMERACCSSSETSRLSC